MGNREAIQPRKIYRTEAEVLDLWIDKAIKPRLKGKVYYVRYADDFLIMFQIDQDAGVVMAVLPKRLGKFGLELAEEKTRIMPFGRYKGTNLI